MLVGLAANAGTASALPNCTPACDFHIDPTAIVGDTFVPSPVNNPTPNDLIGQDFSGGYSEKLTLNSNNTWTAFGFILFDAVKAGTGNDPCVNIACAPGAPIPSAASGMNDPNGYLLYAEFTADGTWTAGTVGGDPTVNLNVDHFITPGLFSDVFATQNGYDFANAVITSKPGVDTQLLTAGFVSGTGASILPVVGNKTGSFDLTLAPALTGPGGAYFTAPRPFFVTLDLSGQFVPTGFNPAFPGGAPQTFSFNNVTADMTFANQATIPEPATLTLFGLGLVGLVRQRRNRK